MSSPPKKLRTFTFTGWDGSERAVVRWTPDGLDVFHNGQQVDTTWTPDIEPVEPETK